MRDFTSALVNRRFAIGSAAALVAGLGWQRQVLARAITQRGMVGGGLAKLPSSEAQFSLIASRFSFDDGSPDIVIGSIVWVDATAGLAFTSDAIADYEVLESPAPDTEVRRILGTMRGNDGAIFPFAMTATDGGPPGAGLDRVSLTVGDGAALPNKTATATGSGFSYAGEGPITAGDVHDVDFDLNPGAQAAASATPAS
jgi:hypothetical protein